MATVKYGKSGIDLKNKVWNGQCNSASSYHPTHLHPLQ